jgi:hypothetical protein
MRAGANVRVGSRVYYLPAGRSSLPARGPRLFSGGSTCAHPWAWVVVFRAGGCPGYMDVIGMLMRVGPGRVDAGSSMFGCLITCLVSQPMQEHPRGLARQARRNGASLSS